MSNKIKRPRSLRGELIAGAAIALGAMNGVAHAQETTSSETVVVRATRPDVNPYADPAAPYRIVESASSLFTEPLIDTPKAVTVIPDELIRDLGVSTFRDLFRSQPGITLGTGEGGNAFGDRIFIRGFDARNDVYIDGVRDPGVGSRELFAVQQVEILRGPSGTFGGRGTTGGSVSLVSKQPGEGTWGDAEFTLGTDNTQRATVDYNQEVTDAFAVRVNLMTHNSDVAGRDHVYNDRWGAAVAAAYQPNDDFRIGLDYYHLSTDYLPDWGLPYDTASNQPFDVNRDNFYGVLSRDFGETFADVYTGQLDYRFGDNVTLHSVLRYGQSKNAYTASAPERPDAVARIVSANAKRRDAITEYWTNQSNLTFDFATGGIEHTVVAGYELAREETLNRQRSYTECVELDCPRTANPVLDLDNPDNYVAWESDDVIQGRTTITVDTTAFYALDTLKFSPHWRAFIGVRADNYEVETAGLNDNPGSESDFVSWHGGVVFKPMETMSIYASYASSSNPPCEQLDAFSVDYTGCDSRVVDLDPVDNTSFELGLKATLFGHFDATATVFNIEREGVPISLGFRNPNLGVQDQEVVGVEFTGAGNITERWSVFAGLTVFDGEVADSDVETQIGANLPNVSETSFSATSRYQFTERFYLGGTATYNSEKYGGTVAAGDTQLGDYWRYDLFGGVELREGVDLTFNVLNVSDETYFDALYRSGTPFSYIAPGRSASVTLDVDF